MGIQTINYTRRNLHEWVFGQGFNSPRLHQWETSTRENGQQNVLKNRILADLPLVFIKGINPLNKTFLIGKNIMKKIFTSTETKAEYIRCVS